MPSTRYRTSACLLVIYRAQGYIFSVPETGQFKITPVDAPEGVEPVIVWAGHPTPEQIVARWAEQGFDHARHMPRVLGIYLGCTELMSSLRVQEILAREHSFTHDFVNNEGELVTVTLYLTVLGAD